MIPDYQTLMLPLLQAPVDEPARVLVERIKAEKREGKKGRNR